MIGNDRVIIVPGHDSVLNLAFKFHSLIVSRQSIEYERQDE